MNLEQIKEMLSLFWFRETVGSYTKPSRMLSIEAFNVLFHSKFGEICNRYKDAMLFFSGGLDSSLILAYTKSSSISITYHNDAEYRSRKRLLQQSKTPNIEVTVSPAYAASLFQDFIEHSSIPHISPFIYSFYILLKKASMQGVRTVITGDGSDELFCGYLIHYYLWWYSFNHNTEEVFLYGNPTDYSRYLYQRYSNNLDICIPQHLGIPEPYLKELLGDCVDVLSYFPKSRAKTSLEQVWEIDKTWTIPRFQKEYQDLASSFGINIVSPFTDPEIMDIGEKLPWDQKIQNGVLKYALKESCRGMLPDWLLDQPKIGLWAPVKEWLKTDAFREVIDQAWNSRIWDLGVNRETFRTWLSEEDKLEYCWSLIVLAHWWERNIV